MPFIDTNQRTIQSFNELIVMIITYHFIPFSDINMSLERQFEAGYSFLFCLGLMIFVNVVNVIARMVMKTRKKRNLLAIIKVKRELFIKNKPTLIQSVLLEADQLKLENEVRNKGVRKVKK